MTLTKKENPAEAWHCAGGAFDTREEIRCISMVAHLGPSCGPRTPCSKRPTTLWPIFN